MQREVASAKCSALVMPVWMNARISGRQVSTVPASGSGSGRPEAAPVGDDGTGGMGARQREQVKLPADA
ncbi:hypothetical protein [Microtetraspora malaysiensis]|uniref:hypothetical protein n=1 Tax=Microtetraspora malaysiensis TaxID=161358 RepID=UPI000B055448|nr:hypothetical protein [Microtetraspora malaysiensis]